MTHHAPVLPLYGGRYGRNLIGYVCAHCGMVLTPGYQVSQRHHLQQTGRGRARFRKNPTHLLRARAAKKAIKAWKKAGRGDMRELA